MFTGIIVALGRLTALTDKGGDLELGVDAGGIDAGGLDLAAVRLGDSISVQGACLTVTRKLGREFFADVSRETMAKTTLGRLRIGSPVNLEPSLKAGDALGGHLVSGHVDAVGQLLEVHAEARSWRLVFEVPEPLARFIAPKGSICLNGVSLTVNDVRGRSFDVNIIPHTHRVTTLGSLQPGDGVNVEIDVIARYVDRLLSAAGFHQS
jgi:riboflavin synthase